MIHKFEFDGTKLVLDVHSGALHLVDEITWSLLDDYKLLTREQLIDKYSQKYPSDELEGSLKEIDQAVKQGLLFSSDPLETGYQPAQSVIKALCLHVAHDCNLRCRYCFAGQGPFGGDRSLMSFETGQAAIDFLIKQSGSRKNIEIDFFGGEPLLNFKVVQQLVDYGTQKASLANKKIKFTLTTNALLLNEEIEQYLIEHGISAVLSLDGRKEVHDQMRPTARGGGSYAQVLKNIKRFVEKDPPGGYYIRGTYTRHNLDFCQDLIHLIDQGFKDISVEPVVAGPEHDYSLRSEDLDTLREQYKQLTDKIYSMYQEGKEINFFHFNVDLEGGPCLAKRLSGCGAGHEYMAVTPDGSLYPCHQFVGQPQFKIGDVRSPELNQGVMAQYKEAHVYNKSSCRACWAKFLCSGGCHANAYAFNKTLLEPHSLGCELAKIRLECALYLKAKQYENRGN
ncbi:thioether cross-link-forming SCIFF peptide maturase [Desulfofalx alkaliphila]|uniref:thioether cross-link-forming SCIFF peptide maturase n=1 Tax=Desulfofalx alkaliphila TaxID=105483 RepID=UPI0004E1D6A3|nr:thioether cross-link-forming SCIFF peptide maturase [Desulfofalx alkaliphila]